MADNRHDCSTRTITIPRYAGSERVEKDNERTDATAVRTAKALVTNRYRKRRVRRKRGTGHVPTFHTASLRDDERDIRTSAKADVLTRDSVDDGRSGERNENKRTGSGKRN